MKISLIVAMGLNRQIGLAGKLPWRVPGDLKNFKRITMGHTLIFGRKTYESIGKVLPGRTSIVLTRDANYTVPSCKVVNSLGAALEMAEQSGETETFIAGGSHVYAQSLKFVTRAHITYISYDGEADTFFPEWKMNGWTRTHTNQSEVEGELSWQYEIWDKD